MNATDTLVEEARPYVAAVTERIAGLPAERRSELLDDLTHHLTELVAEADLPLADRLGAPEAFADEYLSSAGIEPSIPHLQPQQRSIRQAGADAWHRVLAYPPLQACREFLPELRPAWWVARGYLLVAVWPALQNRAALPFPDVDLPGRKVTGTILGLLAAALSVKLARRRAQGQLARTSVVVVGLAAAAALVVAVTAGDSNDSLGPYTEELASDMDGDVDVSFMPGSGTVISAEGEPITNLYVYDAEGNLLEGVYIVDQQGRPLATPATFDPDLQTTVPVDADGNLVVNQYPQLEERIFYSTDGSTELVRVPTPVPDIPDLPTPPETTSTTIVSGQGLTIGLTNDELAVELPPALDP